jgi:hypothetical protein
MSVMNDAIGIDTVVEGIYSSCLLYVYRCGSWLENEWLAG